MLWVWSEAPNKPWVVATCNLTIQVVTLEVGWDWWYILLILSCDRKRFPITDPCGDKHLHLFLPLLLSYLVSTREGQVCSSNQSHGTATSKDPASFPRMATLTKIDLVPSVHDKAFPLPSKTSKGPDCLALVSKITLIFFFQLDDLYLFHMQRGCCSVHFRLLLIMAALLGGHGSDWWASFLPLHPHRGFSCLAHGKNNIEKRQMPLWTRSSSLVVRCRIVFTSWGTGFGLYPQPLPGPPSSSEWIWYSTTSKEPHRPWRTTQVVIDHCTEF